MPIDNNFQPIYEKACDINFLQCYPGGKLKYTDLCHLLQLTAGEHAALGGLSFSDMQPLHQAWVLQKMEVHIHELPQWKDSITIKTFVIAMESSTSTRVIELYSSQKLLASAISYWVVMDTVKRRATALALPFDHFLNHKVKFENPTGFFSKQVPNYREEQRSYTVLLSDLDILSHANNVKYLEWCLNFFHSKHLQQHPISRFEMQFIRELKEGDSIIIFHKCSASHSMFEIQRDGKKCYQLKVEH